mmetsp:Transcript_88154/g.156300  ORF Transcript_88154/g.156300 Transcript_88154/m.156300 type:complete len:241 (-) Transcript_88154:260-982(-)|eukprot:CAMPEP_0197654970 /NCGR_PEP_ID=MMETSP1338-20131121/39169_1 /TAXON_ID=43686 ORGANISM="Pelagodinium beii, Strain RCC1491" /NCGR_SAMPLE_ID=MMETSP1338 /ASSEMBLY_ACC=CAM_ASM_000754 /LENGTH=240 /DNA_ID=CAMNT_0043230525 /DNA_START=38 /DNA_END=760 /DNA_ORIENTATION=-
MMKKQGSLLIALVCLTSGLSFVSFTSRATSMAARAHGRASHEAVEGGKVRAALPMFCLGSVLGVGASLRARKQHKTVMKYSTQKILPSLSWINAGINSKDLQNGDYRTVCLIGLDYCVGRTQKGKLFAVGDKYPPTGQSFAAGAFVEDETIADDQFGNRWNVFTGASVGEWCPSPPFLGKFVGSFMTGGVPEALAVTEVRENFFNKEIEVLIDVNAKKAFEADYWKGILDAQGKDDGTYY